MSWLSQIRETVLTFSSEYIRSYIVGNMHINF